MRLLLILMVVATILQAFRISIYYLRKDISSIKKIIEIVWDWVIKLLDKRTLIEKNIKINKDSDKNDKESL